MFAARNQSAQHRLVADNLDVVLNARPVGNAIEQARHVGHIADRLQILVPIQFLDQRDHVDRPRRFRQVHHPRINPPVRVEREIFDPQMLGGLVVGKVVEQDRAQNRAFGLDVRRKSADAVIGSRHLYVDIPYCTNYDASEQKVKDVLIETKTKDVCNERDPLTHNILTCRTKNESRK